MREFNERDILKIAYLYYQEEKTQEEEAEAIDKAVQTIESKKGIQETEAKQIFVDTITKQLGEKKARRPTIVSTSVSSG